MFVGKRPAIEEHCVVFLPRQEMNWSMIPHFTPANSCSACWQSLAVSTGGIVSPFSSINAKAVASSSAADELSPAPRGTFP
jgi:hypothetical protein